MKAWLPYLSWIAQISDKSEIHSHTLENLQAFISPNHFIPMPLENQSKSQK